MENRLYQGNQELISYGTNEVDTHIEIIDSVMTLNNRTIAVKRQHLKQTLYYDMGEVQNYRYSVKYVGQPMLYLLTVCEQHLCSYKVFISKLEHFIEALDILSTGHLPITF